VQKARKRFGQNFLVDNNIVRKIVQAISPATTDHVVEIGPGHGALTQHLVDSDCHLSLIEIDRDLSAELQLKYPAVELVTADVLKVDFRVQFPKPPIRVVGNLPYNISTPLLFKLFRYSGIFRDMHFMLQLEVVNRMTAEVSSRDYGRLTIMTSYYCEAIKLFEVPPEAFSPRPKVRSAIVRLIPRAELINCDQSLLEEIVTRAFSSRRKTIRNGLKQYLSEEDLSGIGIDPGLRPENLTLEDFIACTRHVSSQQSPGPRE
jgi:16S rRNA (adenine1518-N6/adenine1519-N6)-dimethyltransferase